MIRALMVCAMTLLSGTAAAQQASKAARAVFDAVPLQDCFEGQAARVSVVLHPDGAIALAFEANTTTDVRECVEPAVRAAFAKVKLEKPKVATVLVRSVKASAPAVEPEPLAGDGKAGDVCRWGERRGVPFGVERQSPTKVCGPGLTCCAAGGAAGSDSVCMAVRNGMCPPYP